MGEMGVCERRKLKECDVSEGDESIEIAVSSGISVIEGERGV